MAKPPENRVNGFNFQRTASVSAISKVLCYRVETVSSAYAHDDGKATNGRVTFPTICFAYDVSPAGPSLDVTYARLQNAHGRRASCDRRN